MYSSGESNEVGDAMYCYRECRGALREHLLSSSERPVVRSGPLLGLSSLHSNRHRLDPWHSLEDRWADMECLV